MIPTYRPSIRRRDMDSVLTCMVNDTLGPGDRGNDLVTAVSGYLGIGGGIALRERPRALALALAQLDLPSGSTVVMDPLVPASYHDVVTDAGMRPLYVDVASDGTCIDVRLLEEILEEGGEAESAGSASIHVVVTRTTLGYVPDMARLEAMGIPVIEDISEGLGANTGDKHAGSYGRFVIVGMEPDAIITAGGGTLLLAATKADAGRLKERVAELPAEALLPDLNAALGLTQIRELERFVTRRAELAAVFSRAVMRGKHAVPAQPGDAENVHFAFPVVLDGPVPEVRQYARKKGVETAMAFDDSVLARYARMAAGSDQDAESGRALNADDFPNARALTLRCVCFPLYPALTGKEATMIERVLSTLP